MNRLTTQGSCTSHTSTSDAGPAVRRYAGKVDLDEVFVTDWRPVDDLACTATVLWPRHHAFYTPSPDRYTLLLFTESVRQVLAVTSSLGLGVPAGHRMGWERLVTNVTPGLLTTGADPATVELDVRHEPFTRRGSGLARLTARIRATRDGRTLGTAFVRYTAYPPALYDRLRGEHADARAAFARALPPGPPVHPSLVGRTDPRDVVLAEDTTPLGSHAGGDWTLRTDTGHPVLFDHPHDHVPGMVLLEAADQAFRACAAPERVEPIEFDTTFSRYVEFDRPCRITAGEAETSSGRRQQVVTGLQDGATVFSTRIGGLVEHRPVLIPRQRRRVIAGNRSS
ncbi:ScbA/BarX family gamma-butyrolactone biosynthesis protein [Streptomyces cinereoruber]|uniref:ScbA/BarX family gamma-butyrolactone biosynthesis protein n=1 Tax=Streptomyces cinereoruber TaxID=67260 RepID=UPI0036339C15